MRNSTRSGLPVPSVEQGGLRLVPATHALESKSTVNHARHEIHQYPDTCMTCAEEFELCACPERCEIHA